MRNTLGQAATVAKYPSQKLQHTIRTSATTGWKGARRRHAWKKYDNIIVRTWRILSDYLVFAVSGRRVSLREAKWERVEPPDVIPFDANRIFGNVQGTRGKGSLQGVKKSAGWVVLQAPRSWDFAGVVLTPFEKTESQYERTWSDLVICKVALTIWKLCERRFLAHFASTRWVISFPLQMCTSVWIGQKWSL